MGTRRSNYYKDLSEEMKLRYETKIKSCAGIDPYLLKDKELSNDRSDFPEITLLDIGKHMVHSVSPFTKKQFKNYKGMEAYSFFQSGFVLKIGSKKIVDCAILKGKVKHSQKMNARDHQVWVLAKMDGEVLCAHCTCLAGLSETCSHVGAICFAVMTISESTETSVTDILCKWNIPKFSEVSMSSITDINWTSSNLDQPIASSEKNDSSFRSYINSLKALDDQVVLDFINLNHSDGLGSALSTIFYPGEIRRISNIKDEIFLANLFDTNYMNCTHSELVHMGKLKMIQVSEEDIEEISRLTLRQRKSKLWIPLRRGRITGTNLKECCVTNINNPSITTISRVIHPTKHFDHRIPSVKYQRKNKTKAIKDYFRDAHAKHENYKFQDCGLIFNQNLPYFTDSSDGLVSCDCHGRGCLEIKCLKILESQPFDALIEKPNNILNKFGDEYVLEKSHEFFYKVQMEIYLSDSEYCHFVLWSPTQPLILQILPDVEFWDMVKAKALKFHQEVVMPELLAKFYTAKKGLLLHQQHKDYVSQFILESSHSNEENYAEDFEYIGPSDEECDQNYHELIGLEVEILNSENM